MSRNAKSVIAACAAVVITGIQAWQVATAGGFRPVDLLPVATAVVGAVLTRVVPNVPELPAAKAWVAGALAVLTALSTFVGDHPSGVTAANLLTVAAGALLTWYVPELAPSPPGPDGVPDISSLPKPPPDPPVEITDALRALDQHPAAVAAPEPPTAPMPAVTPAPAPVEPTPIGDAAATAARALTTDTAAMPAIVPNPNMAA